MDDVGCRAAVSLTLSTRPLNGSLTTLTKVTEEMRTLFDCSAVADDRPSLFLLAPRIMPRRKPMTAMRLWNAPEEKMQRSKLMEAP